MHIINTTNDISIEFFKFTNKIFLISFNKNELYYIINHNIIKAVIPT